MVSDGGTQARVEDRAPATEAPVLGGLTNIGTAPLDRTRSRYLLRLFIRTGLQYWSGEQRLRAWLVSGTILAVVIAVATVIFWRLTKPDPAAREGGIRWVNAPEGVAPPAPAAPATPQRADDGTASGAPPAAG